MNGPVCTAWPRLEQLRDPKHQARVWPAKHGHPQCAGLKPRRRTLWPSTVCGLEAQDDALDINTGDLCTRSSEPALLFLHVDGPDVGSPSTYWHKDSQRLQVGSCVAVCFVQHSSSSKVSILGTEKSLQEHLYFESKRKMKDLINATD